MPGEASMVLMVEELARRYGKLPSEVLEASSVNRRHWSMVAEIREILAAFDNHAG